MGDTGFEPVTSSVSGKRATAAPIALATQPRGARWRWVRDSNPCTRLCRPLPNHSANPPGDALASYGTALPTRCRERRSPGADDRIRTGDPHLGKVMLYQLSYVRMTGIRGSRRGRYWVRTSDLFRVKEARYHCANRPKMLATVSGGLAEAYMSLAQVAASRTCEVHPAGAPRERCGVITGLPDVPSRARGMTGARSGRDRRRRRRGRAAAPAAAATGGDVRHDQRRRFALPMAGELGWLLVGIADTVRT